MTPAEELAQYLKARTSELDGSKIVPMLCEREEAAASVLSRKGWMFELKLDGVRIIADKRGDKVKLFYRKLREATESYAEVGKALEALPDERVVLDGEIVAFDEQGRPDFQRLGHRIQTGAKLKAMRSPIFVPVVYVVFDVLAIGPYDVRGFPLEARKEILSRIIPAKDGLANGLIRQHPTFDNGVELFRLCRQHRLEGVVSKKLGSSYKVGERSTDWLKIKCEIDAEFVVIGWTEGESDRARLGALDLGAYEGDRLVFRGRVGSGLHASIIDKLLEILLPIEVSSHVAEGKYSPKPKRHHCKPELVVSVRYGGFSLDPSGARFLRFPVFRGIRADVDPRDCTAAPEDGWDLVAGEAPPEIVIDEPAIGDEAGPVSISPEERLAQLPSSQQQHQHQVARTRRIHITAPTTPIFADGTTKDALCKYFEQVAPAILRHAHGRACTLMRPDGTALWPPPKWAPKFARTTTLKAGKREVRGFILDSVDTLLFSVEAVAPCLHHGPFVEGKPGLADFVAVRVTAKSSSSSGELARAALAVRDIATELGLPCAAKSASGQSIDIVIGVGSAPAITATPLGTLIAHLATKADNPGIEVATVEGIPTPFAPCASEELGAVVVAVPIEWEELEGAKPVDISTIGFAEAIRRAASSAMGDALSVIAEAPSDIAGAMRAIEKLVASRSAKT